MSDDLVKELRFWNGGHKSDEKMKRAADRIEKLEAALREIANGPICCPVSNAMRDISQTTLTGERNG